MKRENGGEREKERVRERGDSWERGRARREIEREVREVRERGRHNLGL